MFVGEAKFYLKIWDNHNSKNCGYDLCIVVAFWAVRRCFITIQCEIWEVLPCDNGEQFLCPYYHYSYVNGLVSKA